MKIETNNWPFWIPLGNGIRTYVDKIFILQLLNMCSWYYTKSSGRVGGFKGYGLAKQHFELSREVAKLGNLNLENEIDHINRNTLDNRLENLRSATSSQQKMNMSTRVDNLSGVRGVCWSNSKRKYRAYININGVQKHLGYFDNLNDAEAIYVLTAKKYFGQFYIEGTDEIST